MDLIRLAITRPIAVVAAVIMVVLFGLVALQTIPIQLAPDVRKPVITVETRWPGAAPAEVEREIINRQEEALKGLDGLEEMLSESEDGKGEIELTFRVGQNMDRALLLVSNRLDRVSDYPAEASQPTLSTAGNEDSAIAWFVMQPGPGNDRPIQTYGDFAEDMVKSRLERVPGVSRVNVFGGAASEMRVTVDPERMAHYRLTVGEVVTALRRANVSATAGKVDEGKRRYVVRTEGRLVTPADIQAVVVRSQQTTDSGGLARVTVADIATVAPAFKDPTAVIRHLGERSVVMNAQRETGANVIRTMEGIRAAVQDLNEGVLEQENLTLRQVYDETVYIDSAIALVQQNIWMGGALAAVVLLVFLRSWGATLVVSIAIPISVIGAFVAMAFMGRSLNVISLAGIAFAVGMVVDAAIVVLENIYRLRQEGLSRFQAAYQGARQVWGAILVSALTTVMVFIPILAMELEVGQLFRDIAVAISVSVSLSLLVAVTLIPALSRRLLGRRVAESRRLRLPLIDPFGGFMVTVFAGFARVVAHSRVLALLAVMLIVGAAGVVTWAWLPKLEYLPEGNRNLVFGMILPPPGYNLDTTTDIATRLENAAKPLWATETGPEAEPGGPPKIDNFFFVALRNMAFVGASAVQSQRASELIPLLRGPIFAEPGTFGFLTQPSLFGRGIGGGRSVDINISGPDLTQVLGVALKAMGLLNQHFPRDQGNQFRPKPGLELGAPEVRVLPDRMALADNGLSASDLGMALNTFNDGMRVEEITVGGKRIDLTLRGPEGDVENTQRVGNLPVVTADGHIVPVSSLARVEVTAGPTEIRHIERARTVTLEMRPSTDLPLEAAMETIQDQVIAPLQDQGLPPGVSLTMSGTADKLTETWQHMMMDLLLAIAIVYLVMAVLFESFLYPLIIVLSVPLATAGGVLGLAGLNLYTHQPLDMLTLLGFVILVGIVVNNAILLVHQTLFHMRHEMMAPKAAIVEATRNRIRPIFMSTLTSVVGMLPLVLVPGAGSELYRGLGSVVIGGLALSAVLTLTIIPPLLSLTVGPLEDRRRRRADRARPATPEDSTA